MRRDRIGIVIGVLILCVTALSFWYLRPPPAKPVDVNALYVAGDLRDWIEKNFIFYKDSAGLSRAFIRRRPVRALLYPGSFEARDEAIKLIAELSSAAGVSYELTSYDSNLTIVVDEQINDGDKPNPKLWKRLGLTQEMYDIVAAAESWAGGCANYTFGNREGQILLTLVVADTKLAARYVRDCVIDGVIRAFGLNCQSDVFLRADDGYVQYVTLAQALRVCEQKFGGAEAMTSTAERDQKLKYVDCATEALTNKQ